MTYVACVELASMGAAAAADDDDDVSRLPVRYLALPRSNEYNLQECVA
jgi:hypothetical protein